MEDNGTFLLLTSYGTLESYGRYKAMTPIMGTKEECVQACVCVCVWLERARASMCACKSERE